MEELALFLEHIREEKSFSENTKMAYTHDVGYFVNYLSGQAGLTLAAVTPEVISAYLLHLSQEGKSPHTISRHLAALRTFFHFLEKKGLLQDNPAGKVASPRVPPRYPETLTVEEVERLLAQPNPHHVIGQRDRAILEVLYATGLRVSELIGLNLEDAVVGLEYLRCVEKNSRERVIPLGKKAVEALKVYLEKARPHLVADPTERALFVNARGKRLTRQGCWKIVKGYARLAGLEKRLTPHTLRHSFAVHLLTNGAELSVVQELLGHASMATTQVYSRLARGKLREVYTKAHPRA